MPHTSQAVEKRIEGTQVSTSLKFLLMLELLSVAVAFRLSGSSLLGLIVLDYMGFSVSYRLVQTWHVRNFAKAHNLGDVVARKLINYWR
jgi:hypothetical protein